MSHNPPLLHANAVSFRQALASTFAATGFSEQLIEKDYFCSLFLHDLAPLFESGGLVFKGGTSLSKVHSGFYRLSEDLDFAISMPVDSTLSQRRARMADLKAHLATIGERQPVIRQTEAFHAHSRSTHYVAGLSYDSAVDGHSAIKIEISLREPTLENTEVRLAQTAIVDPFHQAPAVAGIPVRVLSMRETFAEKFRAALTRAEPAIRDFFDIDFALRHNQIDVTDKRFLELLRQKLAVRGNLSPDVSESRLISLTRQVESKLRPVLREIDLTTFDLESVFRQVSSIYGAL